MKIKKQMEQGSPFYENQEADGAGLTVLCHRAAVLNLPEAVAGSRSTNEGRELVLTKHCEDISQGWPFNCRARVNKRPKIKLLYFTFLIMIMAKLIYHIITPGNSDQPCPSFKLRVRKGRLCKC